MGIVYAILIFSFIVFFHELGHFTLAKLNGIDVYEFALGMGPLLISREYKGTKYSLRLLPIGGYCAMGEDEEENDSLGNFNKKSVWARIAVIAAGPVFNFILAFIVSVILVAMIGYDKPIVSGVTQDYPAAEAGIQEGDVILHMGNKKINIFREIVYYNQFHQGEEITITFRRGDEVKTVTVTPKMDESKGYYRIGLNGGTLTKANPLTALQYGVYEVKFWICTTLSSLKQLVTGGISVKQLSGPVGIVDTVDDTYQQSKSYGAFVVLAEFFNIGILLSANLGVMNLLPLPALDGGRLVFLFIEAVRRKRIPPEKEGNVHLIGLALLMILMLVVMYNDIAKIFFK